MLRQAPQLLRLLSQIHHRVYHNDTFMSIRSSPSPSDCSPYPKPISDLPPPTARIAEQTRAAASELAALYGPVLDSNSILYQDEWLMILDKPARVYCEHLLKSVPMLLGSGPYVPQPSIHRAQPPASPLSSPKLSSTPLFVALADDNASISQNAIHSEGRPESKTSTSNNSDSNSEVERQPVVENAESPQRGRKTRPPSQPHYLANRLDRDTSGVIVVAKQKEVAGKLGKLFSDRGVNKSYIALCYRSLPPSDGQRKEYDVSSGHGRSRHGLWRVYDSEDVGRELPGGSAVKHMHTKIAVLGEATEVSCVEEKHKTSGARKAPCIHSDSHARVMDEEDLKDVDGADKVIGDDPLRREVVEYGGEERAECDLVRDSIHTDIIDRVVEDDLHVEEGSNSDAQQNLHLSTKTEQLVPNPESIGETAAESPRIAPKFYLMRAHPTTGRTHQIRLHAQHIHLPLAGDVRYGGPQRWIHEGIEYDCHALHAESISFRHPYNGNDIFVAAPLPAWANIRK